MRRFLITGLCVGIVGSLFAAWGLAQQKTSTPSLGDLARKLRAQREKSGRKPVKIFTNDNLPARPPGEGQTASSGLSATTQKETKGEASATEEKASEGAHDEAYYRKRAKEIQDQLELHKRELAVLEQKVGNQQNVFYTDPNKTLQQTSTPAYVEDVGKLEEQIDKKKQQIADDEKAMDDLREQLRREGGDPGWLR